MTGWLVPLAALAASSLPAPVPGGGVSSAQRAGGAASAQVSVRIVRTAAIVGHGRAGPRGAQPPRAATIEAADGSPVRALIYDFE